MLSPANTSRFIAKISTRVRVSTAKNGDEAVRPKGPGLCVTDSKAIALVDTLSLIRTGRPAAAASPPNAIVMPTRTNRGTIRTKVRFAQGSRLVFIEYGSIKD